MTQDSATGRRSEEIEITDALARLADELHFKLGQLGGDGYCEFSALPLAEQEIYTEAVTHILLFESLVKRVQQGLLEDP